MGRSWNPKRGACLSSTASSTSNSVIAAGSRVSAAPHHAGTVEYERPQVEPVRPPPLEPVAPSRLRLQPLACPGEVHRRRLAVHRLRRGDEAVARHLVRGRRGRPAALPCHLPGALTPVQYSFDCLPFVPRDPGVGPLRGRLPPPFFLGMPPSRFLEPASPALQGPGKRSDELVNQGDQHLKGFFAMVACKVYTSII